ncbi:MAG: hypothetical protein GXO76_02415 [Calditrichaeota bacterium]|nr:hypothetical protein [Calditrichota bacterium]
MKRAVIIFLVLCTIPALSRANRLPSSTPEIVDIGSQLELFVDHYLIDTLKNVSFQMHHPIDRGPVLQFDEPWEGPFSAYCTIIKDGDLFRLYYRGGPLDGKDGSKKEFTCYAKSNDGTHWTKPNLKIYNILGTWNNNVVLADAAPVTHNFTPFLDTRAGVNPKDKYKALGGLEKTGLIAYVSADGLHWKKLREKPVIGPRVHDFDSQNVSFWSEAEQLYLCYFRHWIKRNGTRYRSVARTTSKDFIHWTKPVEMTFGNTPPEQLYTNQTSPYFRAPQIYISVAARFMKNRQVLTEEEAKKLHVNPKFYKDCSDAIFMTTRGGNRYDRTFMESFIRPGIGLDNWASRSNYPALNIVRTSPTEMSLYLTQDYAQPGAHLHRYTLRIDGFTSINAPYKGGEMITRPFRFTGDSLLINFSTSAAGFIKVEILDENGRKIKGFELKNATEMIGNEIERAVTWRGNPDLAKLNGTPVRLRFVMKDADLYSFRFR